MPKQTQSATKKPAGWKDGGGTYWIHDRSRFGRYYKCKTCGREALGVGVASKNHEPDCQAAAEALAEEKAARKRHDEFVIAYGVAELVKKAKPSTVAFIGRLLAGDAEQNLGDVENALLLYAEMNRGGELERRVRVLAGEPDLTNGEKE